MAFNVIGLAEVAEHKTLIGLQNLKLIENPPFFIHAVSGWAFHKT